RFAELRQAAVAALQQFIARQSGHDQQAYEQLQARAGYGDRQAGLALKLLHGFTAAELGDPAAYDLLFGGLRDEKVGVRELAAWRLAQADPEGAARARFNAGDADVQRERAIAEWRKRIPEGKLPPGRSAEGRPPPSAWPRRPAGRSPPCPCPPGGRRSSDAPSTAGPHTSLYHRRRRCAARAGDRRVAEAHPGGQAAAGPLGRGPAARQA